MKTYLYITWVMVAYLNALLVTSKVPYIENNHLFDFFSITFILSIIFTCYYSLTKRKVSNAKWISITGLVTVLLILQVNPLAKLKPNDFQVMLLQLGAAFIGIVSISIIYDTTLGKLFPQLETPKSSE